MDSNTITAIAIFTGILAARILEFVLNQALWRNQRVDEVLKDQYQLVKHTQLEPIYNQLAKLNEAVFPDKKPECALGKSSSRPL